MIAHWLLRLSISSNKCKHSSDAVVLFTKSAEHNQSLCTITESQPIFDNMTQRAACFWSWNGLEIDDACLNPCMFVTQGIGSLNTRPASFGS